MTMSPLYPPKPLHVSLGLSLVGSFQSATVAILHLGNLGPPKGTARDSRGAGPPEAAPSVQL